MGISLRASVIIPVYNGSQTLAACLLALRQQTQPPTEIIVVDDGSTDESAAVAAQFGGVTLISQNNAGPAAARNHGAQVAQEVLLLFTDADCVASPDWVEQMIAPFTDPTVAGAKGIYRTRQPELVARFVQQEYQDRYDRMVGQSSIDFVDTYAAAYRRDVFLATGGFDATFLTASVEDQEFSFRLAGQGHRLVYVPGAIVYHQHDRTIGAYLRRKFWIGYWKARVTRRYPAKLTRDSHTPQVLKVQMGLAAIGGLFLFGSLFRIRRRKTFLTGLALTWGSLLLSSVTFLIKIGQRDPAVLIIAPLLIFIRAWALGLGFLLGNLRFIVKES